MKYSFAVFLSGLVFLLGRLLPAQAETITTQVPAVTVHGKKRSLLKRPVVRSEFEGEQIDVEGASESSLGRIISASPSILMKQTGGEGVSPIFLIRGQDPTQSRYFIEGVPISDAAFNSGNLSLLPVEMVSSANVYAEGVPAFLVADGLGGAINFSLKRVNDVPSGTLGAKFGNYGYFRVNGESRAEAFFPWLIHIDYTQSQENFTYFDDNGTPFNLNDDTWVTRTHNQFRRFSFFPTANLYDSSNLSVRMFSLSALADTELPGPVDLPTQGNLRELYNLTGISVQKNGKSSPSVEGTCFFRYSKQDLVNQDPTLSPSLPNARSTDQAAGLKGNVRWKLGAVEPAAQAGVLWEHYDISASNAPKDLSAKQRLEIPFGSSLIIPIVRNSLRVTPAVMTHFYSYDLGGISAYQGTAFESPRHRSYLLSSPRLGITFDPFPLLHLRGAVGHYYRAPTLFELYGDPSGVSPSRNLTYEEANKIEAGADVEWKRPVTGIEAIRVSYTWSTSRAKNLIDYIQNSQQTRVAVNVGESRIRSHELAIEGRAKIGVGAKQAVSLLSPINLSPIAGQQNKRLPGRPEYRSETTFHFEKNRFQFHYGLTILGPSYWDLNNMKRLSTTITHRIGSSWQSRDLGTLSLEILNLTDVKVANSTLGNLQTVDNTTGYLGYPAAGRRVFLSWQYVL